MSIRFECKVDNVSQSKIPDVEIVDYLCSDNTVIRMDIHRRINIVSKGDTVSIEISKELPSYIEGRDFVAHGYVITKRRQDTGLKIYISLWGFLVVITSLKEDLDRYFNYMDKVYMKISK